MITGRESFPSHVSDAVSHQVAAALPLEFARLDAAAKLTGAIAAAAVSICRSSNDSDSVDCASVFRAAVYDVCEDDDSALAFSGRQSLLRLRCLMIMSPRYSRFPRFLLRRLIPVQQRQRQLRVARRPRKPVSTAVHSIRVLI
jgi:hypothetical protein